jgi:hypothetical protein
MGVLERPRFAARRVVRRVHERLGDDPRLLPLQLVLTPEGVRERTVRPSTQLVVEGFPRSGNTFAAMAIRLAQPEPPVMASHVHIPAQVRRAAVLHVPILLVVRPAEDAVVSMAVADPHHRVRSLLRYWVHYHRTIVPLLDQLVVGTFEQVTTDLAAVVERVNDRFECELTPPDSGPDATERVFAAIDLKQRDVHAASKFHQGVARPDARRADAAAERRVELEATAEADLRSDAAELYERFASAAT